MAGQAAYGTVLKKGSPTPATIADVLSIGVSGVTRAVIDTTAIDDNWKQFVLGAADAGSIDIEINCTATSVALWLPAPTGSGSDGYEIDFPSPLGKFAFTGLIQNFTVNAEQDGAIQGTVTIKVTGAITYT